ncbi:MAG: winged helix-turn-helix domain-containing protein [Candidatus Colwellbacteria bacterium]|nr:winged helix-turn-helix domain-containing protein [Candidatus Colwellbacteria bacterium]
MVQKRSLKTGGITTEKTDTNQKILECLKNTPGLHKKEIAARLGIGRFKTAKCLRQLKRSSKIVRIRRMRYTLYFLESMPPPKRKAISFLRVPLIRRLAEHLVKSESDSLEVMSESVGATKRVVRRTLRRLKREDMLRFSYVGRNGTTKSSIHLHPDMRVITVQIRENNLRQEKSQVFIF